MDDRFNWSDRWLCDSAYKLMKEDVAIATSSFINNRYFHDSLY